MNADLSIFFSWQSDTEVEADNRAFIRSCLETAGAALQTKLPLEEAVRIDAGVEGLAGTPEVATAIFDKISASAILVADVTLVASSDKSKKRRQPNSNVSIEMGYGAAVLGWDRVICVMNEAFGNRFSLPFDHKNRRFPITYSSKNEISGEQERLTETLTTALKTAEESELKKVAVAIRRLDTHCLRLIADFG